MGALFESNSCGLSHVLQKGDRHVAEMRRGALHSQVICLEVAVVEAVKQEIHEIRHNSFRTFRLQELHDVVVGGR